jgi:hypothetical protein
MSAERLKELRKISPYVGYKIKERPFEVRINTSVHTIEREPMQ